MSFSRADLPSRVSLARELVSRRGILGFQKAFWHVIAPSTRYQENWHHGAIGEFLQGFQERQFQLGIVNIPPAHTKSTMTSVMFPCWQWSFDPGHAWFGISYNKELVLRDAEFCMRIIQSPLFKQCFPDGARLSKEKKPAIGNYWTTEGGRRYSTTPDAGGTGEHADSQLWDDPIKAKAVTKLALDHVWTLINKTFANRHRNPVTFGRLLTMQRLHKGDPAGRFFDSDHRVEHLCLPFEYVPRCQWDMGNCMGITDPRTEPGEILWPERYPTAEAVKKAKLDLGRDAHAQLQQNPVEASGGYVEEDWLRWVWTRIPEDAVFFQSWDFGHKGEKESHSNTVGQLWAVSPNWKDILRVTNSLDQRLRGSLSYEYELADVAPALRFALIDEVAGVWNYPKARGRFKAAQKRPRWDLADVKLIEDKANGVNVRQDCAKEVSGMTPVEPGDASKTLRFSVQTTKYEGGLVLMPAQAWADKYREEIIGFPRFGKDDRVDTSAQFLEHADDRMERHRRDLAAAAENCR